MERRKFLIGAGSTALGASALVGSGAFSYVRADRDVTIAVVSDSSAYLKLEENSAYADEVNGQLELDFASDNGEGGEGLNDDADTRFDNVFKIKNQGTNDVRVSIQDVDPDLVGFYEGTDFSDAGLLNGGAGNELPVLEPGEEITVSLIFWLRDDANTADDVRGIEEIGIVAEEP